VEKALRDEEEEIDHDAMKRAAGQLGAVYTQVGRVHAAERPGCRA